MSEVPVYAEGALRSALRRLLWSGGVIMVLGTATVLLVLWAEGNCSLCQAVDQRDGARVQRELAAAPDELVRSGMATQALHSALGQLEMRPRDGAARSLVRMLLEAGADPNDADAVGGTRRTSSVTVYAVERVIRLRDQELLELFIARGLNVAGRPGGRALAAAAAVGDLAIAQRLLALGADVNTPHPRHGSPLAAAIHARHQGIIALLDERGAREW